MHALICTNAYTYGIPIASDIERRILPITVAVVATAPLPPELRKTILPQNHLVTDTKNLLNYYRLVEGGRLLFGRSEEHTSELQSLMRISYAVFCLIKQKSSSTSLYSDI